MSLFQPVLSVSAQQLTGPVSHKTSGTVFKGGGTVIQDVTFATTTFAVTTLTVKLSGLNPLLKQEVETMATGSLVVRDRTADPICALNSVIGTVN